MKRTFWALTVCKIYWMLIFLLIGSILFVNVYYTIILRDNLDVSISDPTLKNDFEVQILPDMAQGKNERQSTQCANGSLPGFELIALVQVHKRIENLKLLIESLSKVRNVSKVLIIFSRDYSDKDMDEVIGGIKFTKKLQMFYPFSIQRYHDRFPGDSPDDCPRDIGTQKARLLQCANAEWPDAFGHYREANFTQMKHHWWWKINALFDQMSISCNYGGPVLLLEEDYYVSPDVFHTVKKLYERKESICSQCSLLAVGSHAVDELSQPRNLVHVSAWHHRKYNIGIVLDRKTWNGIKNCSSLFCTFDDYNWDVSLHSAIRRCAPHLQWTLATDRPRIFHLGICGTHTRASDNCDLSKVAKAIQEKLVDDKVEAEDIQLSTAFNDPIVVERMNGGWGDLRDQELCKSMVSRGI